MGKSSPLPLKLPLSLQKTLFRSLGGERGAPVRTVFDGPPVVRGTFFVPGGRSGGEGWAGDRYHRMGQAGRVRGGEDGADVLGWKEKQGSGQFGQRPLFEVDGLEIYAKGHPERVAFCVHGDAGAGQARSGGFFTGPFPASGRPGRRRGWSSPIRCRTRPRPSPDCRSARWCRALPGWRNAGRP